MTAGKTIALTRWTFVGKVMFLLVNMLSMLVIVFLPRSKCLFIIWFILKIISHMKKKFNQWKDYVYLVLTYDCSQNWIWWCLHCRNSQCPHRHFEALGSFGQLWWYLAINLFITWQFHCKKNNLSLWTVMQSTGLNVFLSCTSKRLFIRNSIKYWSLDS